MQPRFSPATDCATFHPAQSNNMSCHACHRVSFPSRFCVHHPFSIWAQAPVPARHRQGTGHESGAQCEATILYFVDPFVSFRSHALDGFRSYGSIRRKRPAFSILIKDRQCRASSVVIPLDVAIRHLDRWRRGPLFQRDSSEASPAAAAWRRFRPRRRARGTSSAVHRTG
jgi:hypothetical protein